jgi:hypothetical protein
MSPIFAVIAFVLSSLLDPASKLLSADIKKNLNWFAENADTTHNIINGLFVLCIVFLLIGVYQIISIAFIANNSDDRLR